MYFLLIPLRPAKVETWFSVIMLLWRRGGGMIISSLHANICVVVVENSSIRISRIEFHDISSGENIEMESVCRFSSVATSRSERRHSRRSALSVWCVCVFLQGSKIKLRLPSFVTLALPRTRSTPIESFPSLARSSTPGSAGEPSCATSRGKQSYPVA